MSKVICEICGTTYQDTAECCPICGCSRDAAQDLLTDDILEDAPVSSRKKQIFDYDEVNPLRTVTVADDDEEDMEYEEAEEETEEPRQNTFVVILLTVLIAALLLAAGFIFVRYFLPNSGDKEETVPPTTMAAVQEATEATTLSIPCDTLFLNSSKQAVLNQAGFSHLINVVYYPENTTDQLTFTSGDDSVATVTADGKITAVGEGETVVTIACGEMQMIVNVVCDFTPETEPAAEPTEATQETVSETAPVETEGTKEVSSNVVLKLKRSDISLGVYYQFRLELDCDLDPKDVEWSSEHKYIATVDEEGLVTAKQRGTTEITAKYGDQVVTCIVRCG